MNEASKSPWRVEGEGIAAKVRDADGRIVAVRHRLPAAENEANMGRIAALPELRNAAIVTFETMSAAWGLGGRDDDYIHDQVGSDLAGCYFALRAAIAKTTGGQS